MMNASYRFKAILFDMDGVLVNSTARDEASWSRWAIHHGMTTFDLKSTHGRRAVDTLHTVVPHLDARIELLRLMQFDAEYTGATAVLPGVANALASLPITQWAIVTSAPEQLMTNRLHGAGLQIPPRFVVAEMVKRGKPDPEPYRMGASLFGVDPAECLVVEDAPNGIKSAKAAGCRVLAVMTSHAASDLSEADWIVSSLDAVAFQLAPDGQIILHFQKPHRP